jgi:hypothetical protein
MRKLVVLFFLALAVPLTGPANATELPCDCDPSCTGGTKPWKSLSHAGERLSFDQGNHRAWYEHRFWQGNCEALSIADWGTCKLGKQTDDRDWYDVMKVVLTHKAVAPTERGQLCAKLVDLGHKIGFEWSRDTGRRYICTEEHLLPWFEASENQDPAAFVNKVDREVDDILAAKLACEPLH